MYGTGSYLTSAGELRNQLMNTKSTDEVRALLDNDNFGKEC
ncbi:hypothetical protein ACM6Q7_14060 [Peribacillus butanolivorans]